MRIGTLHTIRATIEGRESMSASVNKKPDGDKQKQKLKKEEPKQPPPQKKKEKNKAEEEIWYITSSDGAAAAKDLQRLNAGQNRREEVAKAICNPKTDDCAKLPHKKETA